MSLETAQQDKLVTTAQELQDAAATAASSAADAFLAQPPAARAHAPTMGKLAKLRYTHEAMIDQILVRPGISQNDLAAVFGFTPAWVSNMLASDAFQAKLAERRKEVIDPTIIATIEERLTAMVIRSHEVVMEKLNAPAVKPEVALRALELGAKALGLGGHAPASAPPVDLDKLAERLTALRGGPREIQGEVLEKEIQ